LLALGESLFEEGEIHGFDKVAAVGPDIVIRRLSEADWPACSY
jgi:hypothetical protein